MKPHRSAALAVLLLPAAFLGTSAGAQTLKLATQIPAGHSIVKYGIGPFMECVKNESKGAVQFNFFPGRQIASANSALDVLNKGVVEVSMLAVSNLSDKMPLSGIALLPDMGDTSLQMARAFRKVLDGGGPLASEMTGNKIKVLWIGMLPAYQMVSKTTPLQTLDEIKGKKLRVAGGLMGLTVRSVGGVAVDIPAGDAYMAMQQGTVDGAVFALSSVQSYKLQEVAKAMSGNGSFGTGPLFIAMDLTAWEKLGAAEKTVMNSCGAKAENDLHVGLDAENEQLKKDFVAAGVTIYNFTPEIKAELGKRLEAVNKEYISRISARGVKAQEVYDAYRKALGR